MLLIGPRGSTGTLHEILGMPAEDVSAQLFSFALAGLQEAGRQHAQGKGC